MVTALVLYLCGYIFAIHFFSFDDIKYVEDYMLQNPAIYNYSENAEPVVDSDMYIVADTKIIIQNYNLDTQESTDTELDLKINYLGMNMQELIMYIAENTDEYASDLFDVQNVVLISFSDKKVVIRRNYKEKEIIKEEETTENEDVVRYYIMSENGYIIIYKSDKKSIFLHTEILVTTVEPEYLEQLSEGIPVKDIYEMYGYLEGMTS